jgi:hypothetical protein
MAKSFAGDAGRILRASSETVARAIGITPDDWKPHRRRAFENLALVLALIPDLAVWSEDEKRGVARIIEAKSSEDESSYLKLLRQHSRLKSAVIKLGSAPVGGGDPPEL